MQFHGFLGRQDRGLRLQRDRVYLRYPVQSDWYEWSLLRADSQAFLAPWEPTWAHDALSRGAFRPQQMGGLKKIKELIKNTISQLPC